MTITVKENKAEKEQLRVFPSQTCRPTILTILNLSNISTQLTAPFKKSTALFIPYGSGSTTQN
jgi:hypothetical protein